MPWLQINSFLSYISTQYSYSYLLIRASSHPAMSLLNMHEITSERVERKKVFAVVSEIRGGAGTHTRALP